MRKFTFLISIFLMIGSIAFAQTLILKDKNGVTINSSTQSVSGGLLDTIAYHIKVQNTSGSNLDVKVKKVVLSSVSGSENTFCFDMCYPPVTLQSGLVNIAAGATDSSFIGDYYPLGNAGTTNIRYIFFLKSNSTDSSWVEVSYNGTVGIAASVDKGFKFSNPYPNPSGVVAKFNYSIPYEFKSAHLEIFDLLGNRVYMQDINSADGVIEVNTSEINNGIYFYSFVLDDKTMITRKMVVKH